MDRATERELRKGVKDVNEKVSDLQVSFTKETGEIKTAIAKLTVKQNTGAWIIKSIFTIIIASISGYFGAHFTK